MKNILPALLFLLITLGSYAQEKFSDKIYIENNNFIIPSTEDIFKASIYFGPVNSMLSINTKRYLSLAIGNQFDREIKYSITKGNKFIAFSIVDTSIISNPSPLSIILRLDSIFKSDFKTSMKSIVGNNSRTIPSLDDLIGLDLNPLGEYYPDYKHSGFHSNAKPISITYHDFSITNSGIFLVNAIKQKLKVWKYEISELEKKEKTGDNIHAELLNEYDWTVEENFYISHVRDQLFLFTESGYIFRLGETAEKVGKLPDNLIDSAIVVDKDHDRLYFLKKSHIEEGLTFAEILKKYAQEIKLPGK